MEKKKERIRTRQINMRVTDAEYDLVKEKASYCKISITEYMLRQITDGIIVVNEMHNPLDVKTLADEINKIGVNINQIAKAVNQKGGNYDKEDMEHIKEEYARFSELIYAKIWGIE